MSDIPHQVLCDDINGQAYYGLDSDNTFDSDDGEFESAEYTEICVSDAGYVQDSTITTVAPYQRFDFTIPAYINSNSIKKIEITMKSWGYSWSLDYGYLSNKTQFFVKQNGTWDLRYTDTATSEPITYTMSTISSNIWVSDNHINCSVRGEIASPMLGYGGYINTYYVELKIWHHEKIITFVKTSNSRGLTMIKSDNGNLNIIG